MSTHDTPLYIVVLPAPIICGPDLWRAGLAVYYDPGCVSVGTGETLSYCFLERGEGRPYIWSSIDARMNGETAYRARLRLDRILHKLDENLPPDWPGAIRSDMHRIARQLYRFTYFEPEHRFAATMLQVLERGAALSEKQVAAVRNVLSERGTVGALRHRRHTQWRLMRLV